MRKRIIKSAYKKGSISLLKIKKIVKQVTDAPTLNKGKDMGHY